MTPQEVRLWVQLRQMRPDGFHFRRQTPLLGFYLDFVCFKQRLIVEIDGSQHAEDLQADHDAMRDAILGRAGFRTLRFWNADIDSNLDGIVQAIQLALSAASDTPTRPSLRGVHPPHEGEGETSAFPDTPTRPPLRGGHPPHEGEGRDAAILLR